MIWVMTYVFVGFLVSGLVAHIEREASRNEPDVDPTLVTVTWPLWIVIVVLAIAMGELED